MIQAFRIGGPGRSENITAAAATGIGTLTAKVGERVARIVATNGPIRFAVRANSAPAVATDAWLPEGVVEYVLVNEGERIVAIRGGSSDVTVNVAFCDR